MTSSVEDELRAQVSEFAKSDEALKEVIARLGELDSLISAHQLSRESLDSTTRSINQLAANLGSLLTVSTSSVGDIARVSTEMAAATQRLEIEINKAITSNIKGVTDKIQKSVVQIEGVANSQKDTIKKLIEAVEGIAGRAEANTLIIMERLEEFEASTTQSAQKAAIKTWVAIGIATLIIVSLTITI
jgi:hypothetical protein